MRGCCGFLVAAAFAIMLLHGGGAAAAGRDYGKLTCGNFLAAGRDNMAVIMWWLRGYHAGRSGNIPFDATDSYASRLGYFCGSNRLANLLETSERILGELDRGI